MIQSVDFAGGGVPVMGKLTPTEERAVQHVLASGQYRLQLNNKPGFVNFEDKQTGEVVSRSVQGLLSEYNAAQKEATRARNAEKKRLNAQPKRKFF